MSAQQKYEFLKPIADCAMTPANRCFCTPIYSARDVDSRAEKPFIAFNFLSRRILEVAVVSATVAWLVVAYENHQGGVGGGTAAAITEGSPNLESGRSDMPGGRIRGGKSRFHTFLDYYE